MGLGQVIELDGMQVTKPLDAAAIELDGHDLVTKGPPGGIVTDLVGDINPVFCAGWRWPVYICIGNDTQKKAGQTGARQEQGYNRYKQNFFI